MTVRDGQHREDRMTRTTALSECVPLTRDGCLDIITALARRNLIVCLIGDVNECFFIFCIVFGKCKREQVRCWQALL